MRLELEGVGHRFLGAPWLFRTLTYAFEPGNTYAITGPSGSGKSALLSIAAGWQQPVEGVIRRMQIDDTSWVFQSPHGTPRRVAVDHVAFPYLARGLAGHDAEDRALRLLDRFGLSHVARREFRALSGGEAQRLMLARAIAREPDLVLVDEPTAQLDTATSSQVNRSISELGAQGRIVLVATHDEETRDSCTHHLDLRDFMPTTEDADAT